MALATVCPHCNTRFRVASDQLKLRGGIVRCGACNQVFDGNATLIDLPPPPAPAAPEPPASDGAPAPSASAAPDAEVAALDVRQAAPGQASHHALDFDSMYDPLESVAAPTPWRQPEAEPAALPELEIDEEIVAFALPDDQYDQQDRYDRHDQPEATPAPSNPVLPALPMPDPDGADTDPAPRGGLARTARRNAARRQRAAAENASLAAPAPDAEEAKEPDEADEPDAAEEPEFVTRGRLREQTVRSRRLAMGAGSALLALVLLAQGLTTFRNVLAARFPQWKPVLVASCALFGCRVELPAQIDALSVETGELQALGANTFSYATLLRNPGSLAQAWPHLELALLDANGKTLVRRVFAPADYLPREVLAAPGFAPRSEQPVKLIFELNQLKPSGYLIAIFYP